MSLRETVHLKYHYTRANHLRDAPWGNLDIHVNGIPPWRLMEFEALYSKIEHDYSWSDAQGLSFSSLRFRRPTDKPSVDYSYSNVKRFFVSFTRII